VPLDLDHERIRAARDEGGDALELLIADIWPEAYRLSASMLRDAVLAEDVAQEACAAIVRGLATLQNTASFQGWCRKIIVNCAITAARRRPDVVPLEALGHREVRFDSDDALDLADALATLPVAERGAILLHYYAGLTSREIAEATGLPSSTVRFRLMLARRKLRVALSAANTHPHSAAAHQEAFTDAP
jgi:RNA polymerase sigma-70 factor (ECF subfamily)